jgi:hypothetical protein
MNWTSSEPSKNIFADAHQENMVKMNKHPNRLWIVVLVLGWIFNFLFWGAAQGINFAIFVVLVLLGGFGLLLVNGYRPARNSLWLVAPCLFFAGMTFARQEPLTLFLAYTLTLVPMGILAATWLGGRWMEYGLLDYLFKAGKLVESVVTDAANFYTQVRREQAESGETKRKWPVMSVFRGIVIALPILAFFTALLASADLVFNAKVSEFFKLFDGGRIGDYVAQLLLILFCAFFLAGIFLHAASRSKDEKLLGEDKPIVRPFIGFTETAIVLGSVIVLFFLFVIIQFQYFFGGNANIGIQGYTYSQYARSGFNELVTVAFFSLLLILGLSTVTKRENDLQKRIYSGLSVATVALVMVILASAYQRLSLAIDWHGFSRLRIYPRVFLIWVGILFFVVVILELLHRERYFAFAALLASLGFAVSLSLVNVDDFIVRQNVLRAAQGQHFNPSYLATLSIDAVPALADEFLDPSLSSSIHEGIGAALLCQLDSTALANSSSNDWRSFNLPNWNARQALARTQTVLVGYRVNKDKVSRVPLRVRTPGNVLYECMDADR